MSTLTKSIPTASELRGSIRRVGVLLADDEHLIRGAGGVVGLGR